MTIWPFPPGKPSLARRFPPRRGRPARPGRACAGPRRWRRRRGAAARPGRAAPRSRSARSRAARLPAPCASSPSRSSAAWRSAASIRSPRSAGTASSPVLNARASAPFSLPLACAASSVGAVDADPGAAARRAGAHVGRDLAVGAEREADRARPGRHVRRSGCTCARACGYRLGVVIGRFPQPRPPRPRALASSSSNQWARAAMMISLPCSSVRP